MTPSQKSPRKLLLSIVLPAAGFGLALLMGAGKKKNESSKAQSAAVEAISKTIKEAGKS